MACRCGPPRGSSAGTHCDSPVVLRVGAVAVFVVGLLTTLHFLEIVTYDGYPEIAQIIDIDCEALRSRGGEASLTSVRTVMIACILLGFATTVAGAIGYVGNEMERAGEICTFFMITGVLGVGFLALFYYCLTVETLIEPVVARQASEFCNATFHWTYRTVLECDDVHESVTQHAHQLIGHCGRECHARVETLQKMGGCRLLDKLCKDFDYRELGEGLCLVLHPNGSQVVPPFVRNLVAQRVSPRCCEEACNTDVECTGYAHHGLAGSCLLVTRTAPVWQRVKALQSVTNLEEVQRTGAMVVKNLSAPSKPKQSRSQDRCLPLQWTPNETNWPAQVSLDIVAAGQVSSQGAAGFTCLRKLRPQLVDRTLQTSRLTALLGVIAAGILISATVCACFMQHTLITSRKGRKGAGALVSKMLCPCCFHRRGGDQWLSNREQFESDSEDSTWSQSLE